MPSKEHQTFFPYREGYDRSVLRLGNLAFDFANPRQKNPYIHEDLSSNPAWVTADDRPVCALAAEEGHNCSFGIGLQDILGFDVARSSDFYNIVVGVNGSKVELRDPEMFFQEVILKSDMAIRWLETRLSVISKLDRLLKRVEGRPKIWLLTGLYEMSDAVFLSASNKASNWGLAASSPLPEPTGITQLLGLTVGGKMQFQSGATITAHAKILGKRVWAAQWQMLDVKYMSPGDWTERKYHNQIKLLPILSLVSTAGPSDNIGVAVVTVEAGESGRVTDTVQLDEEHRNTSQLDDEYWDRFNKELERIEVELDED